MIGEHRVRIPVVVGVSEVHELAELGSLDVQVGLRRRHADDQAVVVQQLGQLSHETQALSREEVIAGGEGIVPLQVPVEAIVQTIGERNECVLVLSGAVIRLGMRGVPPPDGNQVLDLVPSVAHGAEGSNLFLDTCPVRAA
jgi:hypothetical protein